MDRERWDGTANYLWNGANAHGALRIQRIQSFRNLVTIQGIGEGKIAFASDGEFQGCWALGDHIHDVQGRAKGDRTSWEGTFEIRGMDGRAIIHGTFHAKRTAL
jgi:hypothetical protein